MARVLFLTDLHFGQQRLDPYQEYEHLCQLVYPQCAQLDLLLLGGDLCHSLLNLNQAAGLVVARFVSDLLQLASEHHFYLRVLRGTYSHDYQQNRFFLYDGSSAQQWQGFPLVRVIESVTYEDLTPIGLKLLYCPDNSPTADLTNYLNQTMQQQLVSQVDLLVSHAYYPHHLPPGMPHLPHNLIRDTELVPAPRLILNGHVHTRSWRKPILTGGSFERFQHGEEEAKGCHLLEIDSHDYRVTFLENTQTGLYLTLQLPEVADSSYTDELLQQFTARLQQAGDRPLYVRLLGDYEYAKAYLQQLFPQATITTKFVATAEAQATPVEEVIELPVLTEANLPEMLQQQLGDALSLDTIKEVLHGTAE